MHKANWDDLRYVLAVAENGSVSAAARVLGVNHATVLRRIGAFEDRHGRPIFDRTPQGYVIPPDRLRVIEAAREVENAMLAVERMIDGGMAPLQGIVRVTSTDSFCLVVLPPIVAALRRDASDLRIDLIASNAHIDLARLQAEVTVRPAASLPDHLAGTVAAKLGFSVYAGPGANGKWLGLTGALARTRPAQWMAAEIPADAVVASADSFVALRELAAAGIGQAVLPCVLGDPDTRLERRRDVLPEMPVDIWVACHADLAEVPRIRAVRDRLARAISDRAGALLGGA